MTSHVRTTVAPPEVIELGWASMDALPALLSEREELMEGLRREGSNREGGVLRAAFG